MNEKKFYNANIASSGVLATWQFDDMGLPQITQGTTASNRLGNKIFVHYLEIRINVFPVNSAVEPGGTLCRLVIVHDKENNGTAGSPSGLSIFDYDNIYSNRNTTTMPKWSILRDWQHQMMIQAVDSTGTTKSAGPQRQFYVRIPIKKRIDYAGTTPDGSCLLKDRWFIGVVSNGVNCCRYSYLSKWVFSDA